MCWLFGVELDELRSECLKVEKLLLVYWAVAIVVVMKFELNDGKGSLIL